MRYRDSIQNQLGKVEDKLKVMEFLVKTKQPLGSYLQTLEEAKESLAEARAYIDREPATMDERSGLM